MGTLAIRPVSSKLVRKDLPLSSERQPAWQRVLLLLVLGYEAAGCLMGGSLLMASPDGRLMDMPVHIMRGAFPDFFIPGLILFSLGLLTTAAFVTVLRRSSSAWLVANVALWALAIWFITEIAILREIHWLHYMWGLPVLLGGVMTISLIERESFRKILLACGIASSLLYAAINVIVASAWSTYDSSSMTVSELSAIGAPTRSLWMVLCTPYTVLVTAFGWGVWRSAFGNKRLRTAGLLLIVYGALGIIWPFAPMHLREALAAGQGNFSDTMHLTLASITELIYLVALAYAATALGKGFRIYSAATLVILAIFGTLTFFEAPGLSRNLPTPFIGLYERINIGVFLLWVVVLADILWKRRTTSTS